jgi:N-acetylneuraminic acid mutarotase
MFMQMQVSEYSFKKAVSIVSALIALTSCIDDPEMEQGLQGAGAPVFEEAPIFISKTASSIEVSASVSKENGKHITERGFVYSTSPNPTLSNGTKVVSSGTGIGSFTMTINELNGNTTYYIRPYATNAVGTSYGTPELVVSTNTGLGVVATVSPTAVHATSAVSGGVIADAGEGSIIERGVYVSLSFDFNVDTAYLSSDATNNFTCAINNLLPGRKYYLKAFVTNTFGTFEGNIDSLVTGNGLGAVETAQPTDIYAVAATVGGKITDIGEGEILRRGVLVSLSKDFTVIDTLLSLKDTLEYSCYPAAPLLVPSQKYYYKAFVENTFGWFEGTIDSLTTRDGKLTLGVISVGTPSYSATKPGSSVSRNGDTTVVIIERGFCWSTTATPTIVNDTIRCGAGEGAFSDSIKGLNASTLYYVRPYAITQFGINYGTPVSFTTQTDIPIVQIVSISNPVNGTVTINSQILDYGSSTVTSTGLRWHSTSNPTDRDTMLTYSSSGSFSVQLSQLRGGETDSMTYTVKAYAINSSGESLPVTATFRVPPVFYTGRAPFTGSALLPKTPGYFAIENRLYIMGGDLGPNYTDKLWYYSIAEDKWLERKPFNGGAVKWPTCVAYGAGAYVFGGLDLNNNEITGGYYYYGNVNNYGNYNTWATPTVSGDTSHFAAIVASQNSMYLIGGKRDTVNALNPALRGDTIKNTVWSVSSSNSWTQLPDFPVKQYEGIAVEINSVIYAGLGRDTLDLCNDSLWASADGCLTWTPQTECTVNSGIILGGVECLGHIFVIDEDYYILEYNPATDTWTKRSRIPVGYRKFHCIYSYGAKLFFGLGDENKLIEYDPIWDN